MLKLKEINSGQASESSIADEIERSPNALTVRDLTRSWRVSDQTIYRLAAAQVIPHFRVAGSLRFDPKAIANWIRQRSVSGS
jgi:predicted DNA-binding transcriptional regulator AlpA